MEEEVAEHVKKGRFSKPVVAFIAGRTARPGKKMGHAGAIISMGKGSVASKERALREAGVLVAAMPSEVGSLIQGLNLN
jgi:succinyl-CoA synthetase alpha subunit